MTVQAQIDAFLASQPEGKRRDLETLRSLVLRIAPTAKEWFLDGKDESGKVVTNPSMGYGEYTIRYSDGTTKEFHRIGLSANKTGISVYIMGLEDKTYLPRTLGGTIGKATVTGYCIRFKALQDIHLDVLEAAIAYGLAQS